MQTKFLNFGGFRFRATEGTKCHRCRFSIFLNVGMLVFCTTQNATLAIKHNGI